MFVKDFDWMGMVFGFFEETSSCIANIFMFTLFVMSKSMLVVSVSVRIYVKKSSWHISGGVMTD